MKLITNRHRNVALLAKQGNTYIHLVRFTATGLEAERITEEQLIDDWSEVLTIPVEQAVARFNGFAHTIGATVGAARLLGLPASFNATIEGDTPCRTA